MYYLLPERIFTTDMATNGTSSVVEERKGEEAAHSYGAGRRHSCSFLLTGERLIMLVWAVLLSDR